MTEIYNLTQVDEVATGDQFPIWHAASGQTRRASATQLVEFVGPYAGEVETVRASPAATGFEISLTGTTDIRLILTPLAVYANGSIGLPTIPAAGQTVVVTTGQAITALSVDSLASVVGAPTTLAANGFFTMQYDDAGLAWRRIA